MSAEGERCRSCRRTRALCFCPEIRRFDPGFTLVLVAHPREAKRTVGTVRIAHLSVKGSRLILGKGADLDSAPELQSILSDPALHCVLLYPGKNAAKLEQSPDWLPPGKRLALFVVDGTWPQAKRMIRDSRLLSSLPQISFQVERGSEYRFRIQPQPFCLSTVEAVHCVVEKLGCLRERPADRSHDAMLEVFRSLVRSQVEFQRVSQPGLDSTTAL